MSSSSLRARQSSRAARRGPTPRGARSARAAAPRPSGRPRTRARAAAPARAARPTRARPTRSPAAPRSPSTASSTPTASAEQVGDRLVLAATRGASSAPSSSGSSSVMPAEAFTISASGQYVTPSPYGQAAAEEHGRALEAGDELAREAALPDAGIAVEREERRAAVANRAREGVLEQLELALAADERRREAARSARPAPTTQTTRCAATGFSPAAQVERADRLELDAAAQRGSPRRGRRGSRPGSASCCSRAARLTASPVAKVDSRRRR